MKNLNFYCSIIFKNSGMQKKKKCHNSVLDDHFWVVGISFYFKGTILILTHHCLLNCHWYLNVRGKKDLTLLYFIICNERKWTFYAWTKIPKKPWISFVCISALRITNLFMRLHIKNGAIVTSLKHWLDPRHQNFSMLWLRKHQRSSLREWNDWKISQIIAGVMEWTKEKTHNCKRKDERYTTDMF